jgi:hypothetical protein
MVEDKVLAVYCDKEYEIVLLRMSSGHSRPFKRIKNNWGMRLNGIGDNFDDPIQLSSGTSSAFTDRTLWMCCRTCTCSEE